MEVQRPRETLEVRRARIRAEMAGEDHEGLGHFQERERSEVEEISGPPILQVPERSMETDGRATGMTSGQNLRG